MGRPKGNLGRKWLKETKISIVNEVLLDNQSPSKVAKKYKLSEGLLSTWIKTYLENGEEAFNKNYSKGGNNPLVKFQKKKELTKEEQLEFEILKLRIENERLKKGYLVEGVGQEKEYITLNKKNSK